MFQKLLASVLAVACAAALALPAFAADAELVLSDESTASALTKIHNYKPVTAARIGLGVGGTVKGDEVFCAVTERICDDKGGVYRVVDSTPLADTTLFSRKTTIDLGAPYVRSIAPDDYDADGFTGSSFHIKLTTDYSGQNVGISFDNCYTARQDVPLSVRSAADGQTYTLLVKKGAQVTSQCQILLNAETIDVTQYPESIPPYKPLTER